MSNISPTPPSFAFSYWRPWKEDSNFFDSYLDYSKDVYLSKYQADTIGLYISQASTEQVQAIGELGQKIGMDISQASEQNIQAIGELGNQLSMDINQASMQQIHAINNLSIDINQASERQVEAIGELGQKIGMGLNILSYQMTDVTLQLSFLNKNLDIQVEQQKVTNLLLENVGELLRVPDSEKERQHCIELGLKFFVNAQKDHDLFDDALEELLEAEKLMKQDYFVLHRIGLIYLYSIKHINPQIALDYFAKAAKYASVESDPKAARLANVLAQYGSRINTKVVTDINAIESLAADSYEKAAFSAYVLGNFELAEAHQSKAVKYNNSAENYFFLAKYQTRTKQIDLCIQNLELAINVTPAIVLGVFKDLDLVNEPKVLKLIEEKNDTINKNISKSINEWKSINSNSAKTILIELNELLKTNYDKKVEILFEVNKLKSNIEEEFVKLLNDVPVLKRKFENTPTTLDYAEIERIILDLDNCLDKPFEIIKEVYEKAYSLFSPLEIGVNYAGGIVFYIDESGKHGLVAAPYDQSSGIVWDNRSFQEGDFYKERKGLTSTAIGEGNSNTGTIVAAQGEGHYAAKMCADLELSGYNDWFLPSKDELNLMYENLHKNGLGGFASEDYWSSSEVNEAKYALLIHFATNQPYSMHKFYDGTNDSVAIKVHAVRAFERDFIHSYRLAIGDSHEGGIVFYLDESGKHGLVAAPSDQTKGIKWYNGSDITVGAFETAIGTGNANTKAIIASQGEGHYAAKLCADLVLGGYNDWFLPSKDELILMCENLFKNKLGGFTNDFYWSSSENNFVVSAWIQNFNYGEQNKYPKTYGKKGGEFNSDNIFVRAVRTFKF